MACCTRLSSRSGFPTVNSAISIARQRWLDEAASTAEAARIINLGQGRFVGFPLARELRMASWQVRGVAVAQKPVTALHAVGVSVESRQSLHELPSSSARPRIIGQTEPNPVGNWRMIVKQENIHAIRIGIG